MRRFFGLPLLIVLLFSSTAHAAHNADVVVFTPANDGGKYLQVQQSSTLQQWRFNVGAMFDYAFQPLEFVDPTGARRSGIVDDLLMANIGAAVGLTDWWQVGANFPVALWESFYNNNQPAATVSKQTLYGKLGDPRFDMKFRLLDIDRYRVGLALVPFVYFPLGKEEYFLGNGMWSPGGTFVVDFDIANRVFLSFNAGYRMYSNTRYDANNTDAILDDTLELGTGVNVRINDEWAVLGEINQETVLENSKNALFRNHLQNPVDANVAARWTPQKTAKGLGLTIGGGRGITNGIGTPEFRAFVGVNYRKPAVVELPQPVEVEAVVEEKIVITQKIHFEFDKDVIRDVSYPIVDDVAMLLEANPQIRKVQIEGHTDSVGSDEYNQKLSDRRANAVRDYLISKGIEPDRLVAVGFGESKPIADNESVRGRARNRRTEFTVLE